MNGDDLGMKFEVEHVRFLYEHSNPGSWDDLIDATRVINSQMFDMSSEALNQMVKAFDHLNTIGEIFIADPERAYEAAKQHAGHNFQPTSSMVVEHAYAGVLGGEVSRSVEEPVPEEGFSSKLEESQDLPDAQAEEQHMSWLDRLINKF